MGRIPTGERKYNVQRLTPLHFNILELVAVGYRNKQIAEALGVSRNTVSNVKNSAAAQPVLEEMATLLERAWWENRRPHTPNILHAVVPQWKALRRLA